MAAIALSGYYLVQGLRGGLDETADQPVSGSAAIRDTPSASPTVKPTTPPSAAPSPSPSQQAQPAPSTAPAASEEPAAALSAPPDEPSAAPSAAPSAPAALVCTWPVNGTILAGYSVEALAYSETMGDWRTHDGLDLAVSLGAQVYAVADGVVSAIGQDDFMGTTVEIDHGNGLTSVYSNLQEVPTVMVDAKVATGSVIGSVGATAAAEQGSQPHLHFAMYQDGNPVDPADYLPER